MSRSAAPPTPLYCSVPPGTAHYPSSGCMKRCVLGSRQEGWVHRQGGVRRLLLLHQPAHHDERLRHWGGCEKGGELYFLLTHHHHVGACPHSVIGPTQPPAQPPTYMYFHTSTHTCTAPPPRPAQLVCSFLGRFELRLGILRLRHCPRRRRAGHPLRRLPAQRHPRRAASHHGRGGQQRLHP